ncbi:MAG: hypothetical protein OSA51_13700 [Octadecabacter sp.]|nr:hypothetical protein [Octadecabacter sp.]
MSPLKRREMIHKENTKLSLTHQCKMLSISRLLIYNTPVGVNVQTLKLVHQIDRVFTKSSFFGSTAKLLLTCLTQASQLGNTVFND